MHAKISDSSENDLECKDLFKNIPPIPKFCKLLWYNYVLLENWNWDTWVGNEENQDDYEDKEGYAGEEDYEPNCEDPDFIVRPFVFLNVQYRCSTELLCSL